MTEDSVTQAKNNNTNMKIISKYISITLLLLGGTISGYAGQLTQRQWQKFNYFYLEAERLKLNGDVDGAFELYQHCLKINPNSAEALSSLAQFYFYLKNDSLGLQYMEKAVNLEPNNYWYCQNLVGIYQQQNKYNKASLLLKQMISRFPNNEGPILALKDIYLQNKDYKNAIDILNQIDKRDGKSEETSQEKLQIYLLLNDNKKAYAEVEDLVNQYPDNTNYRCLLGDVYLNTGKKKEAYDIYQGILNHDPHNEQALISMINYYSTSGQNNLYEQEMDTLLLAKDIDIDIRMDVMKQYIANNEQSGKDSTKIISMFDKIMNIDTTDTQMPMLYSQYLISKNMNKQVRPVLEKIIKIDPTNVPSRLQLLSYAISDDNYKKAIEICEPAIQATPDIVEFYYYLAVAYGQSGDSQKALKTCKDGLTKVTDQTDKKIISDFYGIMGDTYYTLKNSNDAYAAYDSALVYQPDNVLALNNYAYYLSEGNKDLDKAEEMSYKTVKAEPQNNTYLDTYAWILFKKKKYNEAKIWIDNAMKNGGDKSDIEVEHCGDIYYMNDLKDEAVGYWKKSIDLGNKSKTLVNKIEQHKYMEK